MTDTTRRGFFKRLGGAAGIAAVAPLVPKEVKAEPVEDFTEYPSSLYTSVMHVSVTADVRLAKPVIGKARLKVLD